MSIFLAWWSYAVIYGSIIMLGALGETITEKVGHLNLGVPGIMYISGFLSFLAVYTYESSTTNPNAFLVVLIAIVVAFGTGALFGMLYALMCDIFVCNQNVMGLLITSFCVGFAKSISFAVGIKSSSKALFSGEVFNATIPGLSTVTFIGPFLFGFGFMIYLTIVLVILTNLFLKKTNTGLNLRAVGESPASADAIGINVNRYKFIATSVGCGICGLGGMSYVLGFCNGQWSTNNNIEAIGWLAVALVIFASWHPTRLIWGSIIFGFLFWTYNYITVTNGMVGLSELIKILPYLVTILVLIMNSIRHKKSNQPPASLGLSYFRENR